MLNSITRLKRASSLPVDSTREATHSIQPHDDTPPNDFRKRPEQIIQKEAKIATSSSLFTLLTTAELF
jgi:hypothetical protein